VQVVHTFLVLDLGLDIVDGVAALDLEGDGLPGQGLHEDLHLADRSRSFFSDRLTISGRRGW
jgi:hypothetical protein